MPRYLLMVMRKPQFLASEIEPHHAFIEGLREKGVLELAGPFADKTGGAYLLTADSFEAAQTIAFSDPLHRTNSSAVTVYEWNAK